MTPIAQTITWVLLLAAPKPVLELAGQRGRQRRGSDVDQLARLTPFPAWFWLGLFLCANLAGLLVGVTLLLPDLPDLPFP